jgi:hypothetical protein
MAGESCYAAMNFEHEGRKDHEGKIPKPVPPLRLFALLVFKF